MLHSAAYIYAFFTVKYVYLKHMGITLEPHYMGQRNINLKLYF